MGSIACARAWGRPIAVRVGLGRIEVDGVVDSDERKAVVLLALRGIPLVTAGIRSVAEAEENPIGDGVPAAIDRSPAPAPRSREWRLKTG